MVTRVFSYTVVLDACVLYPAPLRDLLMELAASGLYRAKWTDEIHDELKRLVEFAFECNSRIKATT